ncbi:hypothetical protein BJ973_005667 [Actinoplanes tereljensis]|uniref:Uncharacterized protein n=1 Tax=Paractinoplanes tereljensis TaxID=571912 RepID=A0A919NXS0_9ACTN|nr:hypothetical protein [Actinoplanes tereljensis]GIF26308.1 hypothetical protein Ate02nite_90380 [Actinoplanes tereljensis]
MADRAKKQPEAEPARRGTMIFIYSCVWLLLLLPVGLLYLQDNWVHDLGKAHPLLCIGWWGSVGGLVANLEVVTKAQNRWRPSAEFWYLGRPITAALFGGVGYVVYMTLVQASLNTPESAATQLSESPSAIGYVIAFALGLREQTFRDLLARVFDLLATAGGADVEPPSVPPDFSAEYDAAEKGVRISWGLATDNVGVTVYHLYRDYRFLASVRPSSAKPPTPDTRRRLWPWTSPATEPAEEPAEEPTAPAEEPNLLSFVDRSAPQGLRRYAVTAADAADNESAPAGPIAVDVTSGA